MAYTQRLTNVRAPHVAVAGGKGAALGELLAAGVPVPPGFVVTTQVFRQVMAALPSPTPKAIMATPLPAALQKEIMAEYTALGTPYVAVRSSATAEDGAAHAWAGQLESFVPTAKADLITNIKRCWASLFTPRAVAYRAQAGLAKADVAVAVVVQTLVDSQHSGIAFSVHPVTGNTNHMVVEAVHGLGEAAVGGHVTPDTYVLSTHNGHILEMHPGTQAEELVRVNGTAKWRPLPTDAQQLTPAQLQELARHITTIAAHFGQPTDVEWTYQHKTFYIVQSRPITTLQ